MSKLCDLFHNFQKLKSIPLVAVFHNLFGSTANTAPPPLGKYETSWKAIDHVTLPPPPPSTPPPLQNKRKKEQLPLQMALINSFCGILYIPL